MGEDYDPPQTALDPEVERLLRLSVKTARAGNTQGARALLRALTYEHPTELRAWLWLAGVAADPEEQRHALERVLALDPDHTLARQQLAQLRGQRSGAPAALDGYDAPPAHTDAAGDQPQPRAPHERTTARNRARRRRQAPERRSAAPWIIVVAGALALALLAFLLINSLSGDETVNSLPQVTPVLGPQTAEGLPPPAAGAASPAAETPVVSAPPATAAPTLAPTAAAVMLPTIAAPPAESVPTALPMGSLLERDGWRATLLRPDYALVLDGAIGNLQPSGRFVLALLSVGNVEAGPRRIPGDLFLLNDSRGRTYAAVPGASSAYLAIYGRGLRGDLSLEDDIPAGGGMFSVPLIFDIPPDTTTLMLIMGPEADGGWPVVSDVTPDGATLPQPTPNAAP